ncbi:hypothetical protein H1Q78_17730 [Cellulosimicrobium cellulans]|uniref:hypothetical protein n=1 Tax=Cellulosimicrobium cellulans TaxID=1710 RepID=UPI001EDC45EC|nr:hypothetical protein [Cellulosimicrobium cellulans]UKJ63463.1 hypothetical protein H1Q78_17730 [Cellulosimicrobium cellulans]
MTLRQGQYPWLGRGVRRGGPARLAARELTARPGLADLVTFALGDGDRRSALAAAGGPGQDGLVVVFGQEFVTRIGNNVAATRAGLLAAVVVLARA